MISFIHVLFVCDKLWLVVVFLRVSLLTVVDRNNYQLLFVINDISDDDWFHHNNCSSLQQLIKIGLIFFSTDADDLNWIMKQWKVQSIIDCFRKKKRNCEWILHKITNFYWKNLCNFDFFSKQNFSILFSKYEWIN